MISKKSTNPRRFCDLADLSPIPLHRFSSLGAKKDAISPHKTITSVRCDPGKGFAGKRESRPSNGVYYEHRAQDRINHLAIKIVTERERTLQ